jgi:hypothetical protein
MSAAEIICRIEDLSFSFVTGTSTGGLLTIGGTFSLKIRAGESGTGVDMWGKGCVRKVELDEVVVIAREVGREKWEIPRLEEGECDGRVVRIGSSLRYTWRNVQ